MKKAYVKPEMDFEEIMMNQSIAACSKVKDCYQFYGQRRDDGYNTNDWLTEGIGSDVKTWCEAHQYEFTWTRNGNEGTTKFLWEDWDNSGSWTDGDNIQALYTKPEDISVEMIIERIKKGASIVS